jgi:hypothetical protein
LTYATLYYYNVTSCNQDGYCSTSGPLTFTTDNSDNYATPTSKGYCTAVIVERHSNQTGTKVGPGDVVNFFCELPNRVFERQPFGITVINKDASIEQEVHTPDPVFGDQVVIYPK